MSRNKVATDLLGRRVRPAMSDVAPEWVAAHSPWEYLGPRFKGFPDVPAIVHAVWVDHESGATWVTVAFPSGALYDLALRWLALVPEDETQ